MVLGMPLWGLPLAFGRFLRHNRHCTTAGYARLADAHLVEAAEKVGAFIAATMTSQHPRSITPRLVNAALRFAGHVEGVHQSGATASPV